MNRPQPSELPPSGFPARIVYLPGHSGQAEITFHAAMDEGVLYSPLNRPAIGFVAWSHIERLEPLGIKGKSGSTWGR